MKIFLIGLPGSGKSTLGKAVAKTLKIPFLDLDHEIEKEEGRTISKIFKDDGENYFRILERDQLQKWSASPKSFVMATGGGAPCFFNNMEVINGAGKSIFLDVPGYEIVKRLKMLDGAERPLFAKVHAESLKDKVEFMRSARLPFYRQAHLIVARENIQPEELLIAING